MHTPTIIGTSSFAASGGSALTNILEEFNSVVTLHEGAEFECKFFTDNILALEISLRSVYGVDNAIKAFLFNAKKASVDPQYYLNFGDSFYECAVEYIDSISDWYLGAVHKDYDYTFLDKAESKMFKKAEKLYDYMYGNRDYQAYEPYHWEPSFIPFGKVYYADFPDDFYKKTQAYIEKVFSPLYVQNKRYLLADAIYTATSTTPNELMYYKDSKALIANRDPRDLYVINKEIYGEWYMPTWNVDSWIKYYKHRRQCIKPQKENNQDNILHIQFENLIYDYEDSLSKIKKFLDLSDEDHVKKGQIFIPEKSIQNTQMFRKYPKYFDDIKKIEKELSEFCYDYSETQIRYFAEEKRREEKRREEKRSSLEDIRKNVCIFQKKGKLPFSSLKGALVFSTFYSNFTGMKKRTSFVSKIKGLLKITIGLFILPFEFIYFLISIKNYQNKTHDRVIEFK